MTSTVCGVAAGSFGFTITRTRSAIRGAMNGSGSKTATASDRLSWSARMSCAESSCATAGNAAQKRTLDHISSAFFAIAKVDEEADDQPNEKTKPGFKR